MISRLFLALLLCLLQTTHGFIDVLEVNGEPDFRSIKLQWKASGSAGGKLGFLISYCEEQAWGKHRCKEKAVNNAIDAELGRWIDRGKDYRLYESTIDGLRIATDYKVEVKPTVNGDEAPAPPQRARALGGDLLIKTKAFQAKAIKCLANSSLVEIETGPYFGGKISVEGSTNKNCSTQGNAHSSQTTYFIDVDHFLCGSEMLNTSVKTFLIVQENLPILTHSTRRFMVVCKYVPETFTVRAGVNLPDYDDYENDLVPVGNDVYEVDPSELFDSTGSFFNSKLVSRAGRAMKLTSDEGEESQKVAHLVLMVVLIMCAVLGVSCAVFHFVRQSRRKHNSGFISPEVDPSANEINENLEAIVRDFGEPQMGDTANTSFPSQPPVALTGAHFDSNSDKTLSEFSSGLIDSSNSAMVTSGCVPDGNDATLLTNLPKQHVTNINVEGESLTFHTFVQPADDSSSNSEMDSLPSFIPADHRQSVSVSHLENIDAVFNEGANIQSDDDSAFWKANVNGLSRPLLSTINSDGSAINIESSSEEVIKESDKLSF